MDISEHQNMLRQAYNITDLNLPRTAFYDETNNTRKFSLSQGLIGNVHYEL